jgi:NAD(P)-dependent dehydrogenase (short-subunit alcohol dehydrogenase family)
MKPDWRVAWITGASSGIGRALAGSPAAANDEKIFNRSFTGRQP